MPLHQVFVYKTHVLPPLLQLWRCAPEEDVLVQDQLDGWEDVEEISNTCPTFLKIIRIELTSHFSIEKSSRACCQEILRRPAVATNTCPPVTTGARLPMSTH